MTAPVQQNHILVEEDIQVDHARAVRCLIRKLDRRLIPFLAVLQFCSYLHQIGIGHIRVLDAKGELNLTEVEDRLSISLFYIAYLLFEIPSNIILRLIGPTNYLSMSMIAWGSITVGMAFAKNVAQLLPLRFLLGMAESGFFPGIVIYISLWYRKQEQTMRIILFFLAVPIAGIIGGILAYLINKMPTFAGLSAWGRILFLEGLPIIPLGFLTLLFFANVPETVRWLNPCEKQILTNMLREDVSLADGVPESINRISSRQVRYVFSDWRIYLYTFISIGNLGVIRCWTVYFPSIVQCMTSEREHSHWWPAPAYAMAALCVLIVGYSSYRTNDHGLHLAFTLAMSALGFFIMAFVGETHRAIMYISITVACCGTFASFPILLSWVTINVGGRTKRALAIGFVSGLGKLGGIISPFIYDTRSTFPVTDKDKYRRGHIVCATVMTIVSISSLLLRFLLHKENNRRAHLTRAEHEQEATLEEPCDRHPDVRYVL